MSNWHDQWQPGSFRGVSFKWRNVDAMLGRKTARHDYPLRDEAYIEDLGKRPREFMLECYVIGKNYTDQRDALIAALEKEGPGTLIHPTMGMMLVAVNGDVRMTESTSEGGMCRFSIPFCIAPENKSYPSAAVDTASDVDTQADNAIAAVENDFKDSFSVDGQPQFVSADGQSMISDICDDIDSMAAAFPANVETPAMLKDLVNLKNSVSTLIGQPFNLAQSIADQFSKLRDVALSPLYLSDYASLLADGISSRFNMIVNLPVTLFNAYADRFDYGRATSSVSTLSSDSIRQTTPARIAQAANRDAINALVRITAMAEAARTASEIDFVCFDDAIAARNKIIDAIDAEMLEASDSVYIALADLRATVIKDISVRCADLSRIIKYTPARTEPALVIAQRLYGDATRAQEIISRNNIKHPLFVPGGVELEVLSD